MQRTHLGQDGNLDAADGHGLPDDMRHIALDIEHFLYLDARDGSLVRQLPTALRVKEGFGQADPEPPILHRRATHHVRAQGQLITGVVRPLRHRSKSLVLSGQRPIKTQG